MQAPTVLRYVELPTQVGGVVVLMSRRGVFDIVLVERGATAEDLITAVQSRFPETLLVPDHGVHGSWAAAAVARIDGVLPDLVAPIDSAWSAPLELVESSAPVAYERAS